MNDEHSAISRSDVIRRVGIMDEAELSQLVSAVLRRYGVLFPEEEVVFLSWPRDDPAERKRVLEYACRQQEQEIEK